VIYASARPRWSRLPVASTAARTGADDKDEVDTDTVWAMARLVRDKALSDLLNDAVRQGWRIERERKHVKCLSPDGQTMVVVGYSAHGNRALENARAELRRAGLRSRNQ